MLWSNSKKYINLFINLPRFNYFYFIEIICSVSEDFIDLFEIVEFSISKWILYLFEIINKFYK